MTLQTFLLATLISILILVFVRKKWSLLLLIAAILDALWTATYLAFCSMLVYAVVITGSAQGWKLTFLYFFMLYIGIIIVLYHILTDITITISGMIRNLFKK